MWPSIKPWLDWVIRDFRPLARTRPHVQSIYTRYEKAGLTLYDLPIPWNADAVVVEVLVRCPPAARRKSDFVLRLPGREPAQPELMRAEANDLHRLLFRLPTPAASTTGELLWKAKFQARVSVPVLTADDFLAGLTLATPTLSVRLGTQTVAALTFVAPQCKGLVASAVLRSRVPLAPVADLGLRVVFRSDRPAAEHDVPVPLTSSQLAGREALVTAMPPKHPRRSGEWAVSWRVGDRELAAGRVRGIPARRFEQSLRVSDSRFVVADKTGVARLAKQVPPPGEFARLGPCFLVASSEPGMAGVCRLEVTAVSPGDAPPTPLMVQDVLVTDGPTVFAPGLVDAAELGKITSFEVRHRGRVLGVASLSPVPSAVLTAEGGFKPPPEFAWSNVAEDELSERLTRLMGGSQ
jgi:hypothetical protein